MIVCSTVLISKSVNTPIYSIRVFIQTPRVTLQCLEAHQSHAGRHTYHHFLYTAHQCVNIRHVYTGFFGIWCFYSHCHTLTVSILHSLKHKLLKTCGRFQTLCLLSTWHVLLCAHDRWILVPSLAVSGFVTSALQARAQCLDRRLRRRAFHNYSTLMSSLVYEISVGAVFQNCLLGICPLSNQKLGDVSHLLLKIEKHMELFLYNMFWKDN